MATEQIRKKVFEDVEFPDIPGLVLGKAESTGEKKLVVGFDFHGKRFENFGVAAKRIPGHYEGMLRELAKWAWARIENFDAEAAREKAIEKAKADVRAARALLSKNEMQVAGAVHTSDAKTQEG